MIKRLVYVHFADLNSGQANVIHVARMADAFSGLADNVTVAALAKGPFSETDFLAELGSRRNYGLSVTPLRGRFYANILGLWLRTFLATKCGTSGVMYTRSAVMATVLSALPLPLIIELHAPISSMRSRLRNALLFLIRRKRFRSIVVISARLKEIVESELSLTGMSRLPTIVVAHDGANAPGSSTVATSSSGRLRVGYAGHLYPGRGVDLILECAKRCPAIDFEIAGGVETSVEEWRSIAADIPNIRFLGRMPPVQVEEFLLSCEVLLAPYATKVYTEGGEFETGEWMSPLKIFEYMAAGKPMICSRMPVIQEVLEDTKNCILCPPGDAAEWVAALKKLAQDPVLRARLGEQARIDLLERFTWDARAKSILESSGFP